jgi:peroxiredoxin|tara:strand:- start:461 stop:973 length:513 start_codon:yes stop_codon:yes gene_type:complete
MNYLTDHIFKFRENNEWVHKTTDDLFKDKKIAMFGLPGAFTPTCSNQQLPGYEKRYNELIDLGINDVYCMSVNDAFVMNAWADNLKITKVKLIPDGDGVFTRSLGMLVDKPVQGFGFRSWRYSCIITNKFIKSQWIEEGFNNLSNDEDPFEISDVATMINSNTPVISYLE